MKHVAIMITIIIVMLLSACKSGPLPEEQIYGHLEQAVKLEAEFENQQEHMVTLEQKEKELYDKIVALGLKEIDEIKQLSAEAIKVVDERRSRLEKENESIQLSKAEFEKSTEIVNEINDEELKNEATALLKLMTDRYTAYNKLYDAYSISLAHDKELYIMFQSEDLTLEQLELQIESINRSYEEVISLNETFNSLTSEYNEKKKEFYQKAGLEVSVKEETP